MASPLLSMINLFQFLYLGYCFSVFSDAIRLNRTMWLRLLAFVTTQLYISDLSFELYHYIFHSFLHLTQVRPLTHPDRIKDTNSQPENGRLQIHRNPRQHHQPHRPTTPNVRLGRQARRCPRRSRSYRPTAPKISLLNTIILITEESWRYQY